MELLPWAKIHNQKAAKVPLTAWTSSEERVDLLAREIEGELTRQEAILAKLHEDMEKGTPEEVLQIQL